MADNGFGAVYVDRPVVPKERWLMKVVVGSWEDLEYFSAMTPGAAGTESPEPEPGRERVGMLCVEVAGQTVFSLWMTPKAARAC